MNSDIRQRESKDPPQLSMSDFLEKPIGGMALGQAIQRCRSRRGLSLEELARRTQVQAKFLVALEAGDYGALPEPVYQRTFLKAAAAVLGLEEGPLLERHDEELSQWVGLPRRRVAPPSGTSRLSLLVTPRLFSALGVAALAAIAVGFLALEILRIVSPPMLDVDRPSDGQIALSAKITVSGVSEPEALIWINGEPVFLDAQGRFREEVYLRRGLNLIKIAAKKPHSEERIAYRRVVWQAEP